MTDSLPHDTIASEGRKLLGFARRDPDAVVPQYPTWTLRDLIEHTASILARTTDVCRTLPQERIQAPQVPAGADALDWYEEMLGAMVAALDDAEPDTEVWFFTAERTIASWTRRMLVETGVHRWDAQQAFEDPEPLRSEVATAGLDEFATMWFPRMGELPTLSVTATDVERSWTFGDGPAASNATGTASDLYLRLMARPGATLPAEWEAAVEGLATAAG